MASLVLLVGETTVFGEGRYKEMGDINIDIDGDNVMDTSRGASLGVGGKYSSGGFRGYSLKGSAKVPFLAAGEDRYSTQEGLVFYPSIEGELEFGKDKSIETGAELNLWTHEIDNGKDEKGFKKSKLETYLDLRVSNRVGLKNILNTPVEVNYELEWEKEGFKGASRSALTHMVNVGLATE